MSEKVAREDRRSELTEVRFEKKGSIAAIAPKDMRDALDFAKAMSSSGDMMPKHLQGNEGACLAVAMDSWNWGMNPFAVAKESFKVGAVIAYQAKVLAAVVNANAAIEGRLNYEFTGDVKKGTRACRCFAKDRADGQVRDYVTPELNEIKIKNSPLWKNDPDQQLSYYAARAFARRHYQDVLMGIVSVDEARETDAAKPIDITPPAEDPELTAALSPVGPSDSVEDAEEIEAETEEADQ